MAVQQDDLSTVYGRVAETVALAPYYLPTPEECDSCGEGGCQACFKCCPCVRCDQARTFKDLVVCPKCGCRVWYTVCAPFVCICQKGCGCMCCQEEMDDELHREVLRTLAPLDA